MTAMTSLRGSIPPTGPWTVEDLDAFPEGTGVRYELIGAAGRRCPSSWLVEPDNLVLTALELADGRYEPVARVAAGESWAAQQPFAVDVTLG